jgi:hypothetical protein
MHILDTIFGQDRKVQPPDMAFGRYTDVYKSELQNKAWEASLSNFEKGAVLQSIVHFMGYLKDERRQNVQVKTEKHRIHFTIQQGTTILEGIVDKVHIHVKCEIAEVRDIHPGWMRMILEENYGLSYIHYYVDERKILCLGFRSFVQNVPPQKLYEALKELALVADNSDDFLWRQFRQLEPIRKAETLQTTPEILQFKYKYLTEETQRVLQYLDRYSGNIIHMPGAVSFVLMSLIYKMDYLVAPEGMIRELLNECHSYFFSQQLEWTEEKNRWIIKKLRPLTAIEEKDFARDMYTAVYSFGPALAIGQTRLFNMIDAQWDDVVWFIQNRHPEIVKAIFDFIAGHALYTSALQEPYKELLHLYLMVSEPHFFEEIPGIPTFRKDRKIDKTEVFKSIKAIYKKHSKAYPAFRPDTAILDYSDDNTFYVSFFQMIRRSENDFL